MAKFLAIMVLKNVVFPIFGCFSYAYFKIIQIIFSFLNGFGSQISVSKASDEDLNALLYISATQAAEMIRTKEIRSLQLVEIYIRRIESVQSLLNAMVQDHFDDALSRAQAVDDYLDTLDPESDEFKNLGTTKPLLGVPFTCKDSIRVKNLKTICGLPIFYKEDKVNEKNADVIDVLQKAGAIHLAITNVPEAGLWWESSNKIYGRTNNPYNIYCSAGGSSGGEASLLSAAGSVIGIGSDFGGSIRIPAMLNGVFGLKPTAKLIPFAGHVPDKLPSYHEEMVTLGPICRYAKDLETMLKVMVGHDNCKMLSLDKPVNMRNLRVFYTNGIDSLIMSPLDVDVKHALAKVAKYFEKKYDNPVYKVDFPILHHAVDIFLASMRCPGALSVAKVLNGFNEEEGINVLTETAKFMFGKSDHEWAGLQTAIVDSLPRIFEADENFVNSKRDQLKREIGELLGEDGILLFPSLPRANYYHNEALFTPLDFVYCGIWNALDFPVVSCPLGLNNSGVPLAVQIVAAPKMERNLLAAALDIEEAWGGHFTKGRY